MPNVLDVGAEIPEFSVKDFEGEPITKEDLLGAPFIIYFYPKDDTPGCTKEACSFRDSIGHFDDLNVMVIGVSPDSSSSHQKFQEKYQLNFPLLADETGEMGRLFGVISTNEQGKKSFVRSTFFCDESGIVLWRESPVSVEGHVERVMQAVEKYNLHM